MLSIRSIASAVLVFVAVIPVVHAQKVATFAGTGLKVFLGMGALPIKRS